MYKLRDLLNWSVQTEINGKWVPKKPISYRTFWERVKDAWSVFWGNADCFIWPEDEKHD